MRTASAARLSVAPASCSTACWRRSGWTAKACISPTSSTGGRPETVRRPRPRSPPAYPLCCATSRWYAPSSSSSPAAPPPVHCCRGARASPECAGAGSTLRYPGSPSRCRPCRCSTRPFCCARRSANARPGATCWRCAPASTRCSASNDTPEIQRKSPFRPWKGPMPSPNSALFQSFRLQIRYAAEQWNFSRDQRIFGGVTTE